jgi:ATP-dependent helicase/DNAse subunit B
VTTLLYLAPAGGGKTAYLVNQARRLAQRLDATPRVVVPSRLQARAWRERMARGGGALGVRVGTFDDLYGEILRVTGVVVTRLADPVQFRLLRALIDETPLTHYAPLRGSPGFVQILRDLIAELKAGGVFPEDLTAAVAAMGSPARLMELARLYDAYQRRLQENQWADYAGTGWLTAEALGNRPEASSWAQDVCLMVDGFDDLTTVQTQVLKGLSDHVESLIITLTGVAEGRTRSLVHKRFNRTRERLERTLGVTAQRLPETTGSPGLVPVSPPLRHLERTLFAGDAARQAKLEDDRQPIGEAIKLIAAPDREAEVRAALRWLKTLLVRGGMRARQVALLARSIEPYRRFITQVADEFGLPVRIVNGRPLRANPAVAALLELLHLTLPGESHLAWRNTVEAWRSPYFDWEHASYEGAPIGITPEDAETLEWVARWGSVIGGMDQWQEVFGLLRQAEGAGESLDEEAPELPESLPTGSEAAELWAKFQRFAKRITPLGSGIEAEASTGTRPCRDFVLWLEDLIGDIEEADDESPLTADLGIARRAVVGPRALADRDEAALNALKDILRGLVWAEEAVSCEPMDFRTFLADLTAAVEGATYRLPLKSAEDAILVADVPQARGVSFRAVAIVGLAEGEFPTTVMEDPFLRDADRLKLNDNFGLALDSSTDSAEVQYLYEAITRSREALLMTRPRIADNGTPWQPSPFWEEISRRANVRSESLASLSRPTPDAATSWPELLEVLAAEPDMTAAWAWTRDRRPGTHNRLDRAQKVLSQRLADQNGDDAPYDGGLESWSTIFQEAYRPERVWSASRLESYRSCPFFFFVAHVLGLEPRERPTEGLDARQLGNIYHRVFEQLYRKVGPGAQREDLLAALPEVAPPILDDAPRTEQFRATAWWHQTRQEILEHVRRSINALEPISDRFSFYEAERTFGIRDRPGPALVVHGEGGDSFRVRGFIDRVDVTFDEDGQTSEGRRIRIIDYKTAGPSAYGNSAIREGKKLQLPLYAMAARDALELGEVVEGFYWHVQKAEPSGFTLAEFRSEEGVGPQAAIDRVVAHAWEAVRGARAGHFAPKPPDGGCPDYCPAAAFCWHYEARRW